MWVLKEIQENKTNWIKKYILFWSIFLVICSVFIYFNFFYNKQEIIKNYHLVSYWDIKTSFLADWQIVWNNQVSLSFQTTWNIKNVYKKVSDEVKIWEEIASIDDKYLSLDLQKAQINLQTMQANLEAKEKSLSKENIYLAKKELDYNKALVDNSTSQLESQNLIIEKTLETASDKLESSKLQNQISIKSLKDNLDTLKISLDNTQKSLEIENSNLLLITKDEDNKISNLKQNITDKINYINTYFGKYLLEIDEFLWVTESKKNLNDSYEMYLSAKNSAYKTESENLFSKLNNDFIENKDNFASDFSNFEIFASNMEDLINKIILVLDNTIPSNSLSQTEINSLKEKFQWYLQTLKQNYSQFISLKQSLDYEYTSKDIKLEEQKNKITTINWQLTKAQSDYDIAKTNYETQINQIKKNLEIAINEYNLAKLNYDRNKTDLTNQVEILKKNYDLTKAKYNEMVSLPTNVQLEPYKKALEGAKNDLEIAKEKLKDSKLFSNVDWYIYDIWFKPWETLNQTNNFVKINTKNSFYIESFVEELNIPKVFVWQNVDLSLDSIDNYTMTWIVSFISDKSQVDENWVIEYKVIVTFNDEKWKIKDWMSISIDYITNDLKSHLIIPNKAIKKEDNKNYVTLKSQEKRYIDIWISNWIETQVLWWVKAWDEILVE